MLNSFIALDFETTGLNATNSRVIEIGAVKVVDSTIVDTYQTLIQTDKLVWGIPAAKVHRIRHHQTIDAPHSDFAFNKLHEFIGTAPIVAHNVEFEKRFLTSEFRRCGLSEPNNYFCSLELARNKIPNQKIENYKISTVADFFSIAAEGHLHRALPDALLCARIWLKLQSLPNINYLK